MVCFADLLAAPRVVSDLAVGVVEVLAGGAVEGSLVTCLSGASCGTPGLRILVESISPGLATLVVSVLSVFPVLVSTAGFVAFRVAGFTSFFSPGLETLVLSAATGCTALLFSTGVVLAVFSPGLVILVSSLVPGFPGREILVSSACPCGRETLAGSGARGLAIGVDWSVLPDFTRVESC